jgi:hypothetical protein
MEVYGEESPAQSPTDREEVLEEVTVETTIQGPVEAVWGAMYSAARHAVRDAGIASRHEVQAIAAAEVQKALALDAEHRSARRRSETTCELAGAAVEQLSRQYAASKELQSTYRRVDDYILSVFAHFQKPQ